MMMSSIDGNGHAWAAGGSPETKLVWTNTGMSSVWYAELTCHLHADWLHGQREGPWQIPFQGHAHVPFSPAPVPVKHQSKRRAMQLLTRRLNKVSKAGIVMHITQ